MPSVAASARSQLKRKSTRFSLSWHHICKGSSGSTEGDMQQHTDVDLAAAAYGVWIGPQFGQVQLQLGS